MAKVRSVHGCARILPRSNTHLTEPMELKDIFKIMSEENC